MTNTRNQSGTGATFVAQLSADEKSARRIADLLSESLDPAETACAAFEQPDGRWQVDVHFRTKPEASPECTPSVRISKLGHRLPWLVCSLAQPAHRLPPRRPR